MTDTQTFAELMWLGLSEARYSVLLLLLLAACITDVRRLRIPNVLSLGGAAVALLYSALFPFSDGQGLLGSLGGLGLGLLAMLPFYALRVMGAGDVKLMAMVGAFLGVLPALHAAFFVVVCGGLMALAHAFLRGAALRLLTNVKSITQGAVTAVLGGFAPHARPHVQSVGKMPYALSLTLGTTLSLVARHYGYGPAL